MDGSDECMEINFGNTRKWIESYKKADKGGKAGLMPILRIPTAGPTWAFQGLLYYVFNAG